VAWRHRATDNGPGLPCMEAVRILQTLGLKPRRTIRIGLWTVKKKDCSFGCLCGQHFGTLERAIRHCSSGNSQQPTGRTTETCDQPEYDNWTVL